MKILTIVPSIYPEKLEKMHHSFDVTVSKNTKLLIISKKGRVNDLINEAFYKYPDYDFYHISNDDCIYHTPLWDLTLAKKGKISYGNDLFQKENLPTFPMIDGDIVRAVGWLQMPTLNRGYCADTIWKMLGKNCECLEYFPDVIIEHKWDGNIDEDINKEDMIKFAEWLPISFRDVNKIKEVLCQKIITL